MPDPVPANVHERIGFASHVDYLHALHQPETDEDYQQARKTLAFVEAFVLQVGLAMQRRGIQAVAVLALPIGVPLCERFRSSLPFELTDFQHKVVAQIGADLAGEVPMQQLLQGDVGSGKVVVVLSASSQVVVAGYQGAFVVPAEVLAEQHAVSLWALLEPLEADAPDVRLLTGSTTPVARRETQSAMNTAEPLIVAGTHAFFQESVRFVDLTLVVVDGQHRFGVEQRVVLCEAREDERAVHEPVMAATPTPRTITMTVFGDLDDTRMSGTPPGRTPVTTYLADSANAAWVERTWTRAAEETTQRRRVYVVRPHIDTSDDVADAEEEGAQLLASVEEVAAYLHFRPALSDTATHKLTGRIPSLMKAQIVRDFSTGYAPPLVATTTIEVGVDASKAAPMVILDAQQFGLAQLHRLQDRVGRSSLPPLCIVMHRHEPTDSDRTCLQAFVDTTGGFELAEADLHLRKEGNVLGAGQLGMATHPYFPSMRRDEALIRRVKGEAETLPERSPILARHPDFTRALRAVSDGQIEWMQHS